MRFIITSRMCRTALSAAAAACMLACTHPVAAQDGGEPAMRMDPQEPGISLERTMRDFLAGAGSRKAARFFPQHGDWEYRARQPGTMGRRSEGIHRFAAGDVERAIAAPDGPLCDQFSRGHAIADPSIISSALSPERWRRSGTRFEMGPRGADGSIWVQWRQEDRRWVIDVIGIVSNDVPEPEPWKPMASRDPLFGRRVTLPFAANTRYASATPWYPAHEPIRVESHRYVQYGVQRQLKGSDDLVHYGVTDGVPVFASRGDARSGMPPEFVWIPVDATGLIHAYEGQFGNGCRN